MSSNHITTDTAIHSFNNNNDITTDIDIDDDRHIDIESMVSEDESNNANPFDNDDNILLLEKDKTKDLDQRLADSHENILKQKQLIIVFCALATAQFLSFVDQTGITISLSSVANELNAQQSIAWAGTASLISNTTFSILFGRFSDIFSRKYTMIAAMLILAFFDLGCGLAQTPTQFYVFRAFCGIGSGGMSALTMVIVSDIVTLEQRGKYQGILGSCVGLGSAIGPFIASAFIEHSTWRKFYFTLFPIVISATLVIFFFVPYTKPNNTMKEKIKNLDYLGFLSSSIFIIFLLIPISGGGSTFSWKSGFVISMIIIGGCFFFIFLFVEFKIAKLPIVPLRLFLSNISLSLLLSQQFFFGICYYSALYYYPYYFEIVRGYSYIHTSCFLLSLVVSQSLASTTSGQIISRSKHYWHVTWFGYVMWMISVGLLNLWNVNNKKVINIITMIINGLGVGCIFQPTLIAVQAHSFKKDRATVISTRNVLRSLGGAIGLAISSMIIANNFSNELSINGNDYFNNEELRKIRKLIYSKINLSNYSIEQAKYLKSVYMKGIKSVFYVWMACIAYCLLVNVFIKDDGLKPIDERDKE